ncbi:metallophosphoesterase family protein [Methanococcoides burtonii]|uniref:metallophosphoesterase family protein n=1 Tax=Methanococcoides burtonii TaxID=29291 RepID=UPI000045E008
MELLLISDIHGNIEALDAALSIPHDRTICLGDLVDYGPDPGGCFDRLRDEGISCVMGNHNNALSGELIVAVIILTSIFPLLHGNVLWMSWTTGNSSFFETYHSRSKKILMAYDSSLLMLVRFLCMTISGRTLPMKLLGICWGGRCRYNGRRGSR